MKNIIGWVRVGYWIKTLWSSGKVPGLNLTKCWAQGLSTQSLKGLMSQVWPWAAKLRIQEKEKKLAKNNLGVWHDFKREGSNSFELSAHYDNLTKFRFYFRFVSVFFLILHKVHFLHFRSFSGYRSTVWTSVLAGGPIVSPYSVCPSVDLSVGWFTIFLETGHQIFLIFCLVLGVSNNRQKLTELDFLGKFLFSQI